MSTSPFKYELPRLFKRLKSQQNGIVQHFIALREKKQYRHDQGSVVVQGFKTVKELREKGMPIKSLAITAKQDLISESDVKYPALSVLRHPDMFPAEHYYVTDINVARRILGTASRPGNHDIFAEVKIIKPTIKFDSKDRLLVFDKINDPGNLGTLIRSASALGWDAGLTTAGTCDLYNDKTIRASRALSLSWQHLGFDRMPQVLEFLKVNGFTPVVADMLPTDTKVEDLWSPGGHQEIKPGTGVWFWNFQNKPKEIPKKVAFILSSEHHGVEDCLDKEIKVSIPMNSTVESLNVANAGSIIMDNLNRFL